MRDAGFEAARQRRRAAGRRQAVLEDRIKHSQPRHLDAVARGGDQVVDRDLLVRPLLGPEGEHESAVLFAGAP